MPAADHRTVGDLLADSDEQARETLLDATPDDAPAMVRSWNQLFGADLWAVLPSAPESPSELDPMERLRAVGEAIGRSVTAGHWPGQGPSDEHLTQVADNLARARHLVEPHGPSQQAPLETQCDIEDLHGQVMHTLYASGSMIESGGLAPPYLLPSWLLSVLRPAGRIRVFRFGFRGACHRPDWDMPTGRPVPIIW